MRKKKQSSSRKLAGRHFNRRSMPFPAPPLSHRAARTNVAPAAEPNYYLELADIALGSEPGIRTSRKEKGKP